MFEIIGFSIYTIIIGIVIARLIIISSAKKVLETLLAQAYIDNQVYITKLAEEIEKRENTNVENTDGFLNFVSQSREWAYEYIEDAQSKLTKVFEEIDNSSERKTVKKVLEVIEELRPLLPERKGK